MFNFQVYFVSFHEFKKYYNQYTKKEIPLYHWYVHSGLHSCKGHSMREQSVQFSEMNLQTEIKPQQSTSYMYYGFRTDVQRQYFHTP